MLLCQRGQSLLIPSPSSLLTLTLKLYHTHPRAGRAGAPRPPTFRKTNAPAGPFFADAFGFVTVHDGILKQRAGHAVAHARRRLRLIASIVLPLCGIAIASTPPLLLHQWGQTLWAPLHATSIPRMQHLVETDPSCRSLSLGMDAAPFGR